MLKTSFLVTLHLYIICKSIFSGLQRKTNLNFPVGVWVGTGLSSGDTDTPAWQPSIREGWQMTKFTEEEKPLIRILHTYKHWMITCWCTTQQNWTFKNGLLGEEFLLYLKHSSPPSNFSYPDHAEQKKKKVRF